MYTLPILPVSHMSTFVPIVYCSGCGKKKAHKNWSMVKPGKTASVIGTALPLGLLVGISSAIGTYLRDLT